MNITVYRLDFTDKSTIGDMMIDEHFECYTLEDVVRSNGVKIKGSTAIPEGTYPVILDWSVRFNKRMPHILNVPNFEGVRIHAGNTDADTQGCVLVGLSKSKDFIGLSRQAFAKLMTKLEDCEEKGEPVSITLRNAVPLPKS